jgi:hypothetical protein
LSATCQYGTLCCVQQYSRTTVGQKDFGVNEYQPYLGTWWRFSSYELWGTYIRPTPGASLEAYDPWPSRPSEDADEGPVPKERPQPIYQSLLQLYEEVRATPYLGATLNEGGGRKLLDWCSRYGLLGLLPHETLSVTMPARWEALDTNESVLVPVVRRFLRMPAGWSERTTRFLSLTQPRGDREVGAPLNQEEYDASIERPRVLRQDLRADDVDIETDVTSWTRFFPRVDRAEQLPFSYHVPLTDEFWSAYSEPRRDFLQAAAALSRFVEGLKRIAEDRHASEDDEALIDDAIDLLPRLLGPVAPALIRDQAGRPALGWLCGSLLSAFAIMALQDIVEGRLPQRCEVCRRYFVSRSHKAIYCSEKCRQTANKRAYRLRRAGGERRKTNGTQS